ncbi:hypothetical protein GOP47_0029414 [Adiantum capillus-veneris]|nr:hypothetical protein GOP47_0029414 [Adiantum capillus-veneris]
MLSFLCTENSFLADSKGALTARESSERSFARNSDGAAQLAKGRTTFCNLRMKCCVSNENENWILTNIQNCSKCIWKRMGDVLEELCGSAPIDGHLNSYHSSRRHQMPEPHNQELIAYQNLSLSTFIQRASLCQLIYLLGSAIAEFGYLVGSIPLSFMQGAFLSLTCARRLTVSCFSHFQKCVSQRSNQLRRLACRIQSSIRGSVDDIGWLQRTSGLPPVKDRTDRFVQLLGLVSNGIHKLPNSYVYLLIPGLFSNHGPLYFVDTKKYFSRLGLTCHIARIHSEASVETNALELKNYIEELYWGCGKRVMLLGHSKGGVDAAAAIAKYWSDLKDKVAGLVVVQSPYAGSPIASDILREGQVADVETRRVMEVIICKIIKGDIRSLEDLTYDKRREFLSKHTLPSDFPTVSFHTQVSIAPGVISTMSHIAHAELPWLPLSAIHGADFQEPPPATKLPVIIPLAAAMAICALHLNLRYGEASDGLVVRKDAEIPGSVVVRPDQKFDHAWMVYSQSRKEARESDASQMCEALLMLLLEEAESRYICNGEVAAVLDDAVV